MHAAGADPGSSKRGRAVPTTDDQIQEKYLERDQGAERAHARASGLRAVPARPAPARARPGPPAGRRLPPQARPAPAEIEEGVAFYGRSGNALMKSFKRLGIDPLVVYGTLCVKCPLGDPSLASAVRGAAGRRACDRLPNRRRHGRARARDRQRARGAAGEDPRVKGWRDPVVHAHRRRSTSPTSTALDEEGAKREFWSAFRSARRLVRRAAATSTRPRTRPRRRALPALPRTSCKGPRWRPTPARSASRHL